MHSLRRTAVTAARKGRTTLPRQPRRYAHDEASHGPKTSHGEGEYVPPNEEGMGKGFWITVGAIPAFYAVYTLSGGLEGKTAITKLIDKYTENQEVLAKQADIHTKMMEIAGSDRVLFMSSKRQDTVEMRFPEMMNVSSPYNVPAGSQVNMDKVIAKFQKEAYEDNERKLQQLQDGTLKAEQPIEEVVGPTYRGVTLKSVTRTGF